MSHQLVFYRVNALNPLYDTHLVVYLMVISHGKLKAMIPLVSDTGYTVKVLWVLTSRKMGLPYKAQEYCFFQSSVYVCVSYIKLDFKIAPYDFPYARVISEL